MLVSPSNFGVVEPGLYRCSKLENDNLPFLSTLNIKSIIILDTEKPSRTINNYITSKNIELFNLGGLKINDRTTTTTSKTDDETEEEEDNVEDNTERYIRNRKSKSSNSLNVISLDNKRNKNEQWMVIEKEVIIQAFELILNNHKYPMLVVDSTSTIIGILRKIQKWNFNSILNEYRIYIGNSNKNNYFAETFLELIQIELLSYESGQVNSKKQVQQPQHKYSKSKELYQPQPRHSLDFEQEMSPTNLMQNPYLLPASASASTSASTSTSTSTSRHDSLRVPLHRSSIDEDMSDELGSIDDMDELDDDLLSASPQIPENLLKFVEQRKQDKQIQPSDSENETIVITPGTSPQPGLGRSSRNNSVSSDIFRNGVNNIDRRRSVDVKLVRNVKFRSPIQQPTRSSYEGPSSLTNKKKDNNRIYSPFEIEEIKRQFDFKYYKNLNKYPIIYENVGLLKLKLPPTNKLPDWFIKGRNYWERNYKLLNN